MSDKILLDTNLWVYLYATNSPDKQAKVRQIVTEEFANIVLSTQVLGELYHVLTRKKITTIQAAKEIVAELVTTFPVASIDTNKVLQAMDIHQRYGFSYWDSLVLATAFAEECRVVFSEDMHHGQMLEQTIQLLNPFIT
jgi:predicted nucleic acid-binding protein